MSKHLRSITEDKRLEGVNKSKIEDGQVYGGKDASVQTNDPETVKLATKHKVQKHDDRVGNDADVYAGSKQKPALTDPRNKRMKPEEKVYESTCNHTEAGVKCEVHGLDDCSGMTGKSKHLLLDKKKMNEATDTPDESSMVRTELRAIVDKANAMLTALKTDKHIEPWVQAKIANAKGMISGCHDYMMFGETNEEVENLEEMPSQYRSNVGMGSKRGWASSKASKITFQGPAAYNKTGESKAKNRAEAEKLSAGVKVTKLPTGKAKGIKEEEQIDEVLTKKTSVSSVIHDFVHSDDPKFKGKSKKERQRMALGAYYSMHPEKSKKVHEDAAEPMLEGGKKKKKTCKEDGQIMPAKTDSGVADDAGRIV